MGTSPVVSWMSSHLGVPMAEIATIGDQPNDVLMFALMFARSGLSIAVANASPAVQQDARPA